MAYTAPALAPALALRFYGYTTDEIAAAAAEGLAFLYDLAAAAAESLGAILLLPLGAAVAAVRDGAHPVATALPDPHTDVSTAVRIAATVAGDLPGEARDGLDHLLPAERAAWRLTCAVRTPRNVLAAILKPLGLLLAPLAVSRRCADVDDAGLGTTEIRAKGGASAAYLDAQGWDRAEGSRKPRTDDGRAVGVWLDTDEQARIERAVLSADLTPAQIARSVLAYC